MKPLPFKYGLAIIIAFHFFGVVGMTSDQFYDITVALTPLNLLVTFFVLTLSQENEKRRYGLMALFVVVSSFFLEVTGVNTGYPFGEYSYGEALGWKWMGTPFMIGINWWIVAYCGALLVRKVTSSAILNALITAVLIVVFDYIMEPVAIRLGYWSWEAVEPPIDNYVTWGATIFIYALLIYRYLTNSINKIAPYIFIVQFLFFLTLYLIHKI